MSQTAQWLVVANLFLLTLWNIGIDYRVKKLERKPKPQERV